MAKKFSCNDIDVNVIIHITQIWEIYINFSMFTYIKYICRVNMYFIYKYILIFV